ncbi:putative UBA/TS-N domain-containing protein [Podospora conica]|nr:putative UBA/TS-N domain-containing protein [Schizothecium conicum]
MGQTDLEVLLDMGFEKARAELAVKKTGGLQGALNWLEENQDKSIEDLTAAAPAAAAGDDEEGAGPSITPAPEGENARSLVCNECGKKFRNNDAASFHASKTDHTDFSESTDEIAPLTEEEKKARLEEMRQKLAAKRANQSVQEKEEAKMNEKIRMKSTRETQDLKEELARKEQIKQAAKKRQEQADDIEAKRKIKAKIEADKAERKRKQDEAKAAREGRMVEEPVAPVPVAKPAAAAHTQARLAFQTAGGTIQKTYPAETTLLEVAQQIASEVGFEPSSFTMTFPKQTFERADFNLTLKEAKLTPSARLIVK